MSPEEETRCWKVFGEVGYRSKAGSLTEHREEGIARSSRNMLDGFCRGGIGWITVCWFGYGYVGT